MENDRKWILIAKKKLNEASPEELAELELLLAQDGPGGYTYDILDKLMENPLRPHPDMSISINVWNNIKTKITTPKGKLVVFNSSLRKWAAAAVILLFASSSFLFYHKSSDRFNDIISQQKLNTISTEPVSKSKIQLPDGTQVWLNANSQLAYNNNGFGAHVREVTLTGEAFFDVAKNENVPFVIHAGVVNITVKGTAFNVKAYPKQKNIETTLIRGLIEITTRQDPERKIIVRPNEKIIIPSGVSPSNNVTPKDSSENSLYAITQLKKNEKEILSETAWMKENLQFDNIKLEDLAPQLESWFSVNIYFLNDDIKQKRFSGIIEKETLEQTLKAMQLSYSFRYSIKGDEVWIDRK